VSEHVQLKLGLVQRLDLMAAANPRSVRRHVWFTGLLGLWALIGAVSSLAVQHWTIAAITLATAALSGFMWWALRRSLHRIPETSRWIEEVSNL
jgi:hypothetical protein